MKRMSFSATVEAVERKQKTVTRRRPETWSGLKPGDVLLAVDKAMGLKAGQKSRILGVIRVVAINVEPLSLITQDDVVREGLPDLTPAEFVEKFAQLHGLTLAQASDLDVRRIEFEYLTGSAEVAALGEANARAAAGRKARERKAARTEADVMLYKQVRSLQRLVEP